MPLLNQATSSEIEPKIARRLDAAGLPVGSEPLRKLAVHLSLTAKWSSAISLTSIRSLDEAIDRHVVESVAAAMKVEPSRGPLLDVGSGNGYPGIPIKILHPGLPSVLLEPHLRRSVFLKQAIAALSLDGVEVRRARIDRPADLAGYAPLGTISMRGVSAFKAVLEGSTACLSAGGRLVLLLGEERAREVERSLPAGLDLFESTPLPFRRSARLLVVRRA